jgi:hypothetical protein
MNDEEARKILALYRPGTADATDPSFKEALDRAKPHPPQAGGQGRPDPELGRWFQEHCASHLSIRNKFREIPVPPGLKDQILAEVRTPDAKVILFRPAVFLRAAAVLVLCLGLAALFWRSHNQKVDFAIYRSRMVRTALEPYGMVPSHDLQTINLFLAGQKAPADYVLPVGVAKAQPIGCAVVRWQGKPVSMICFRSGKPLTSDRPTDLWLFIVDESSVRNGPDASPPLVAQVNKLMTASWTRGGKMYILATVGDEQFLRKYF